MIYSLELENLVQETVLECFFKNGLLEKVICAQKLNQICQKTHFFKYLKYDNSVMCAIHLLCVFISMVDKFENFNAGQKCFPDRNLRIYNSWESS